MQTINSQTLSAVMSVYNERDNPVALLDTVLARPGVAVGILLDDCSIDGIREILRTLDGRGEVTVFSYDRKRGKGAALRTGLAAATCDIVLLQVPTWSTILRIIRCIWLPDSWVGPVLGSRFLGGMHRALSFRDFLPNRFVALLSKLFTGLNLFSSCFRFVRSA